jgi:ABC-2 type transport system permease protein
MIKNDIFTLVNGATWQRGFKNLLDSELTRWWKTKMWWIQCLIWIILSILMLGFGWKADQFSMRYLQNQFTTIVYFFQLPVVVSLMQNVLIGERKSGTAAWILSKPTSRPAFVLSKLFANSLGVFICMVCFSTLLVYTTCIIGRRGIGITRLLDPIPFMQIIGLVFLNHFWFLTLTLMLGALCNNRILVIGIPLAILVAQFNFLRWLPMMSYVFPINLVMEINQTPGAVEVLFTTGHGIDAYIPTIIAVAIECVVFVLVAVWRFNREEF